MSFSTKLPGESDQPTISVKNEYELNIYDLSDCLDESFSNLDFAFDDHRFIQEFSERNSQSQDYLKPSDQEKDSISTAATSGTK